MKDQNKIQKTPEGKLTDEQLRDVNAGLMTEAATFFAGTAANLEAEQANCAALTLDNDERQVALQIAR